MELRERKRTASLGTPRMAPKTDRAWQALLDAMEKRMTESLEKLDKKITENTQDLHSRMIENITKMNKKLME